MERIFTIIMLLACAILLFVEPQSTLASMLEGANLGTALCLRLLCVYSVWLGILNIASHTGVTSWLAKGLSPLIGKIFGKDISPKAREYIGINLAANLLGVGGAATPMAIKAIDELGGQHMRVASVPMIMLLVINASGLQLLPTTIIGMRAAHNSQSPSSIVLPCIAVTIISAILSVLGVKVLARLFKRAS